MKRKFVEGKAEAHLVPTHTTEEIYEAILTIERVAGKVQDEFEKAKPKEDPCDNCDHGFYNCIRGMERTRAQFRIYGYLVDNPDWRCPTKMKWDYLQKVKKKKK